MRKPFAIMILGSCLLWGGEPLTWEELDRDQTLSKEVELHGFLTKDEQGEWIISPSATWKSCCRAHIPYVSLPDFDFDGRSTRPYRLRGHLSYNPLQGWALQNVVME